MPVALRPGHEPGTIAFEAFSDRPAPGRITYAGGYKTEGHGRLVIRGTARIEEGRPRIITLELEALDKELTSELLRKIPLGAIRQEIARGYRQDPYVQGWATRGFVPEPPEPPAPAGAESEQLLRDGSPRRGRGARSDPFYRAIAEAYLRTLESRPHDPLQALTQTLRRSPRHTQLSRHTLATWIRKARADGWLSPSTPGKAGADPGPRLLEHRHKPAQEP